MKILTQITLLLLPLNNFAQANVYHPFPDTNAVWRVDFSYVCTCQSFYPTVQENYQYTIGTDSIIGSYAYKKIYRSGFTSSISTTLCACPRNYYYTYYGGLREDTANKKIYFKCTNSPDTLIYDFSKQVGDTLNLIATSFNYPNSSPYTYTCSITSIDSVLVGSNYHKRFNIGGISMIEGIGSTAGLLEGVSSSHDLVCYNHNTEFYPSTSTSCPLIVGISQLPDISNKLILFPNPANDKITLQSSTELGAIIIYNALGEIVLQTKSKNTEEEINISKLQAGIYTVQAVGRYMKFVKE